jgi:GTP diphosphokinase / guanosine-3',5'-bis(diphosphate) 3'-diphosphatase
MNTINKILEAASFAAQKHRDQRRKGSDAEPYINHPLEVANLLANVGGVTDVDMLLAAILHDTIEDTQTSRGELVERFGDRVAGFVLEVTDDKSLPKQERKRLQIEHAPHLSLEAKQIKLADKISNITDVTKNPPDGWSLERRQEYIHWGEAVAEGLRGSNIALETLFDQTVETAKNSLS